MAQKQYKKKKSKKPNQFNKRVGIRPGKFTMQVDFRDQGVKGFNAVMRDIQEMYRKRWFTQRELADMYGMSVSIVAKIVRCDPKAPKKVR